MGVGCPSHKEETIMSHSLEHFIYTILYAFIFCGALVVIIVAGRNVKSDEVLVNNTVERKTSVVATDAYEKDETIVTMSADKVYLNILSLIDNYDEEELTSGAIRIYVTRLLTLEELLKIKRHNEDALKDLEHIVRSHSEYRCIYTVDEDLKIVAVEYRS